MKKLVILSIMLAVALVGYSQATPGKIVRVPTRTSTFDVNLPSGTKIFCVADSTDWNVKAAGVASTRTINTAWAAAEIEFVRTTVQNSGTRGAVNYAIAIDSTKASYQALQIGAATTSYAGVLTAADKTKLDGIATGSGAYIGETFEAVGDSITVTGSGYYTVQIANVCKDSTAFTVSVNGVELRHVAAGQYTVMAPALVNKFVQLNIPIYKYDVISVSYMK
jgi:hypothetical protein